MKIIKEFIKEELGRNLKSRYQTGGGVGDAGNIRKKDILYKFVTIDVIVDYESDNNNYCCVCIKLLKNIDKNVKLKLNKYNNYTVHCKDEISANFIKNDLEEKILRDLFND